MAPKFSESLVRAEEVFLGRVIGVDHQRVTFQVGAAWKGAAGPAVLQQGQGTDCVFHFEEGRDYLVFASRGRDGMLSASAGHCGFTVAAEDACATLGRLGTPTTPRPDFLLLPAAAAALATVLVLISRRTRKFAPLLALVGAAVTFGLWRGQGVGPSYPLPAPAPTRAAVDTVEAGVEVELARGEKPWSTVVFGATGKEVYGAKQYGEELCAYGLDAGRGCVDGGPQLAGAFAVSADGARLAVSYIRGVQLRTLPTLALIETIPRASRDGVEALAFTADGGALAAVGWSTAFVVDLADGGVVRTVEPLGQPGRGLALSGDGRRAALAWSELGADDRRRPIVGVFSLDDGQLIAKLTRTCGGGFRNVSLDHRGQTLAWAEPDGVQVFDVDHQRLLNTLPVGHAGAAPTLSPDGRQVALVFAGVELWDVGSARPQLRFRDDAGIGPMSFSPDGRRLAVLGERTIRILETGAR